MKYQHIPASIVVGVACLIAPAAHGQQGTCLPDKFINTFHNFDTTLDIAVKGDFAYITNTFKSSALEIYNISDLHNPVLVAFGPAGHSTVHIEGNYAYAASPRSISIVDISDPTQPQTVGSYTGSTNVDPLFYKLSSPFALSDQIATVLGADSNSIEFIDVSDPTTPTPVGQFIANNTIWNIASGNNIVYVSTFSEGLTAVDISDPSAPSVIGIIEPAAFWSGALVDGTTLFGANNISGLVAYDISDPTTPVLLGSVAGAGGGMCLHGNKLLVGAGSVFDVSDPSDMRLEQQITALGGFITGAAINDTTMFIANVRAGIHILDISTVQTDIPKRHFPTNIPRSMAVSGTIGYEAAGTLGLRVLDLTNPYIPALLGSYDTPGSAVSVANIGTTVFVCDSLGGLQIIDAADPSNPLHIADIDLEISAGAPGLSIDIEIVADTAYIVVKSSTGFPAPSRIAAIDISTPASPTEIGSASIFNGAEIVEIDTNGNTLVASIFFVGGKKGVSQGALATYDITNPAAIISGDIAVARTGTPIGAYALQNTGILVLGSYESKIVSYDTTDIFNVSEIDRIQSEGSFWYGAPFFNNFSFFSSWLENDYIYVGLETSRIAVIDISDPSDLTFSGAYQLAGKPSRFARVGSELLVSVFGNGASLYSIESNACNPVCLPDVNHDGVLTPNDFTAWTNAFNNNLPECDQNGDGACTPTDFTAWITNFNAGC